eukprot:PLAT6701.1.p1 GENE.PLAT6701.1~~PLAT6701.1.p1  ORF type:complete len:1282 (-),score=621.95 PLAT6701.1:64-3570(-)
MASTLLSPDETWNISVPCGDPQFDADSTCGRNITFERALAVDGTGGSVGNPRQVVNGATHFLDGSVVYGSSTARASLLRTFVKGQLRLDDTTTCPPNSDGHAMAGPTADASQLLTGDDRGNVSPGLLVLHCLFMAEHNRLAEQLWAQHPEWTDEQLFQEARCLVIAQLQAVTYSEYLPVLLGKSLPEWTAYNPLANPSVDVMFNFASFRYGHSGINSVYTRLDEDGSTMPGLLLRDVYFRPAYLQQGGITPILRGLVTQPEADIDAQFVDDVRLFVEGLAKDLAAVDIQRSRDVGVPSYNAARVRLGLPAATSFQQISSNAATAAALSAAYGGDVSKVDAFVGGLVEDHLPGSLLGPLFTRSVEEQFLRSRDGDPLWYERLLEDDTELLAWVRSRRLADIIADNTGFAPASAFRVPPPSTCSAAADSAGDSNSATFLGGRLLLQWEVDDAAQRAKFKLRGQTTGWLGLGFGSSMRDADMQIGWVEEGGTPLMFDYIATSNQRPTLDTAAGGADSLQLLGGSESDGWTELEWTRPYAAADGADKAIQQGEAVSMLLSMGPGDSALDYHGADRVILMINLWDGDSTPSIVPSGDGAVRNRVLLVHGIVMILMWGFATPFSSFAARFLTHRPYWLSLHNTLMTMVTATSAALASASLTVSGAFVTLHSYVGASVALVCLLMFANGRGVKFLMQFEYNRFPRTRVILRTLHKWCGHIISILALANIELGLALYDPNYNHWFLSIVALILLVFMIGEWWKRTGSLPPMMEKIAMRMGLSAMTVAPRKYSAVARLSYVAMSRMGSVLTPTDVQQQVRLGKKWVILENSVYDITPLLTTHPGGAWILNQCLGFDIAKFLNGSDAFPGMKRHVHGPHARSSLREMFVSAITHDPSQSLAEPVYAPVEGRTSEQLVQYAIRHLWTLRERVPMSSGGERAAVTPMEAGSAAVAAASSDSGGEIFMLRFTSNRRVDASAPKLGRYYQVTRGGDRSRLHRFYTGVTIFNGGESRRHDLIIRRYKDGALSDYLFRLEEGATVEVRGPFFSLLPFSPTFEGQVVTLSHGTGINPFLGLVEEYVAAGAEVAHSLHVIASFASRCCSIAVGWLKEQVEECDGALKVTILYQDEDDYRLDGDSLLKWVDPDSASFVHICGSQAFNVDLTAALTDLGLPWDRINVL